MFKRMSFFINSLVVLLLLVIIPTQAQSQCPQNTNCQGFVGSLGIGTTTPNAKLEIAKDNSRPALLLTHPDTSDPIYDNQPISALKIQAPPSPTIRNFVAGLWIETVGGMVDKGRGILLNNWGASDGIYVQQDGTDGTGFAIGLTKNCLRGTGAVIGTLLNTHKALVLRQELSIDPNAQCNSLLEVEASGSLTEMVRLNSTVNNQVGIISRMTGIDSKILVVKDPTEQEVFVLNNSGSAFFAGNIFMRMPRANSSAFVVKTPDNNDAFSLDNSGNAFFAGTVIIGKPVAESKTESESGLEVGGRVLATGYNTPSDLRLKENITPLSGVLKTIDKIQAISFKWNAQAQSLGYKAEHRELGVIAQEIEAVFPELVNTTESDSYKSVDYGKLTVILLEAIKELKTENESLKRRIELLESK
ncbi:MAG: tail fiber domain-containing protein [Acidobacteriota bacterium]